MKKIFLPSAIITVLCIISGCATLFAPKTSTLSLGSDPVEAEVIVNGISMGITPLDVNLKADKSYTIEFRKEGYLTVTSIVNTKKGGGWIALDLLGGVIPIIIDASTGAWNQLDQDAVDVVLEKQNNR
jgi:hypothetical protein